MTYGLAIKTSQGYAVADVGEAYARARELARRVERSGRVIPVLIGLSAHHVVSGEIRTAHEIGLEMLALFERLGDPNLQMIGEWSVGAALFHLGELDAGHEHLAGASSLYDPAFHGPRVWQTGIEPGIFCRCEFSRTLHAARLSRTGGGGGAGGGRARRARSIIRSRSPSPCCSDLIARVAQRTPRRGAARRSKSSQTLCRRTASRRSCSGPSRSAAAR